MKFIDIYDKVYFVMNSLDSKISELRPNYGYVEKFSLCREIVIMNNNIELTEEIINKSLDLLLEKK